MSQTCKFSLLMVVTARVNFPTMTIPTFTASSVALKELRNLNATPAETFLQHYPIRLYILDTLLFSSQTLISIFA